MSTKIEWTDETWNPVTGCSKVSPGCANCYAERMAKRLAGRFGYPADDPFRVTVHRDKLWFPPVPRTDRGHKRRIFVCSMSDIAHPDVRDIIIDHCTRYMALTYRRHDWLVLTKRPGRLCELWADSDPLPNLWLGVSAENQECADSRIADLLTTPAAVRFVSVEPMLGPIDAKPFLYRYPAMRETVPALDWLIIGCESGSNRRPMQLDWALDLVRQFKSAGVAVFVKQLDIDGRVSKDPKEWPAELRVREYPNAERQP